MSGEPGSSGYILCLIFLDLSKPWTAQSIRDQRDRMLDITLLRVAGSKKSTIAPHT